MGARDLLIGRGSVWISSGEDLQVLGLCSPPCVDQNLLGRSWVGPEGFLINWIRDLSHWDPQCPPGRSSELLQRKHSGPKPSLGTIDPHHSD